jgi:excisionase family DNA binding protein
MIELGHIKVFTCEEVAERLGVSVRRIRSFIKTGQLKARRMGKTYYITEKRLEEFLECDSRASTGLALPSGIGVEDMGDDMEGDMADDISRLDAILGNNEKTQR